MVPKRVQLGGSIDSGGGTAGEGGNNNSNNRPPTLAIGQSQQHSPPPTAANGGGGGGSGGKVVPPSPSNYRTLLGNIEAVSKRYLLTGSPPVSPTRAGAGGGGDDDPHHVFTPRRPERVVLGGEGAKQHLLKKGGGGSKASSFFSMFRQDSDTKLMQEEESKFNSLVEYNEYYRKIYCQSTTSGRSPRRMFLHACHELGIGPEYSLVSHLWSLDPEIDLSCYDMGDLRVQAFAGSLRAGLNPVIKSLDLRSNRLGDTGLNVLLSAIEEGKCQFERLDLSSNAIHFHAINNFPPVLAMGCLCELSLENNSLGNRGLHSLVDALRADETQSLTWLDLSRNEIDGQGAVHVASLLKGKSSLTSLGLAWNSISMMGAVQLCEGLAGNTVLKTLDLAFNSMGNSLTSDSITALGKALAANKHLRHLDVSYNHMSMAQCDVLANYLADNNTLLGLHMAGNPCDVDQEGFIISKQTAGTSAANEAGHHDRILYYPKQTFNHHCWLCGRWREVRFEWSAEAAGLPPGFTGQVFLHMSTDKPPNTPRLMKALGEGHYEVWKMVPPGKLEYYYSYKAPTGEGVAVSGNPDAITQKSADNIISVLSHYKGVSKPTWSSVMSRVYAREIVADMRAFKTAPKDGASSSSSSKGGNPASSPAGGGGGLLAMLGGMRGSGGPGHKSVMYLDPVSLDAMPNLDTMCANALPRLGWMKAAQRGQAMGTHEAWSINSSVFAPRPREVDSRDFYDENPRQNPDAKKRSVVPRAFDADAARACMLDAIKKHIEHDPTQEILNEVVELMQSQWSMLQQVFKAYCCRNEDPFVMSRSSFSTFLAECNLLDANRSSCDLLFYSATSDKLEAAEILKRFNHIILKPSKHGMLRHQFMVGVISLAGQQYAAAKSAAKAGSSPPPFLQVLGRLLSDIRDKAARIDNDQFRVDYLYCQGVDDILRQHESQLREVYGKYSETKFSKSNVPANLTGKLLSFDDFIKMLDHKRILNRTLTVRDARACFVGSMLTVVQEVFLPQRCLSFVDFLEAICRGAVMRHKAKLAAGGGGGQTTPTGTTTALPATSTTTTLAAAPPSPNAVAGGGGAEAADQSSPESAFQEELVKMVTEFLGREDMSNNGPADGGSKKTPPGSKAPKRGSKVGEDLAGPMDATAGGRIKGGDGTSRRASMEGAGGGGGNRRGSLSGTIGGTVRGAGGGAMMEGTSRRSSMEGTGTSTARQQQQQQQTHSSRPTTASVSGGGTVRGGSGNNSKGAAEEVDATTRMRRKSTAPASSSESTFRKKSVVKETAASTITTMTSGAGGGSGSGGGGGNGSPTGLAAPAPS